MGSTGFHQTGRYDEVPETTGKQLGWRRQKRQHRSHHVDRRNRRDHDLRTENQREEPRQRASHMQERRLGLEGVKVEEQRRGRTPRRPAWSSGTIASIGASLAQSTGGYRCTHCTSNPVANKVRGHLLRPKTRTNLLQWRLQGKIATISLTTVSQLACPWVGCTRRIN